MRADVALSYNDKSRYTTGFGRSDMVRVDDGLDLFPRYGVGVGYQFRPWFRSDITLDARTDVVGKTAGSVSYTSGGTAMRDTIVDGFRARDYTGLINGYID
ncbi:MAG: hypothetical protein K1X57_22640, partial [Gemmataceae bacterium]|nr:hypothetical protein [Gemmataceae bacterium]